MRNEYIGIGGIVDHHCFNVLFIINVFFSQNQDLIAQFYEWTGERLQAHMSF